MRHLLLLFVFAVTCASAQQSSGEARPIADNSFFIEEAFNQEEGVVQHLSGLMLTSSPNKEISYTFTQEWPLDGQLHQLSYTLPLMIATPDHHSGLGDVLVHYRYQLAGADRWAAIAPRLSVLLPTGSVQRGLGAGVVGFQVNIPASKYLSNSLVAHANLGITYHPYMKEELVPGVQTSLTSTSVNAGASLIWLASANLNLMLEYTSDFSAHRFTDGSVQRSTESILSPGIRFALNLPGLQIVPGIGVPVFITRESSRTGLFFYLSFEHPF
jgi:hypothetical protein